METIDSRIEGSPPLCLSKPANGFQNLFGFIGVQLPSIKATADSPTETQLIRCRRDDKATACRERHDSRFDRVAPVVFGHLRNLTNSVHSVMRLARIFTLRTRRDRHVRCEFQNGIPTVPRYVIAEIKRRADPFRIQVHRRSEAMVQKIAAVRSAAERTCFIDRATTSFLIVESAWPILAIEDVADEFTRPCPAAIVVHRLPTLGNHRLAFGIPKRRFNEQTLATDATVTPALNGHFLFDAKFAAVRPVLGFFVEVVLIERGHRPAEFQ